MDDRVPLFDVAGYKATFLGELLGQYAHLWCKYAVRYQNVYGTNNSLMEVKLHWWSECDYLTLIAKLNKSNKLEDTKMHQLFYVSIL